MAFYGLPPTLTMDELNFIAEARLVTSGIVPPDWTVMAHCTGHMEPGHWRAFFPEDVIDGQTVSSCPWCYCDWDDEMII